MPPPTAAADPAPLAPSPERLRRARWLVGAWLGLSLTALVCLALGAPAAVCTA